MRGLLIGFLKLCLAVGNLIWPPAEEETPVAVGRGNAAWKEKTPRKRGRPPKRTQGGEQ